MYIILSAGEAINAMETRKKLFSIILAIVLVLTVLIIWAVFASPPDTASTYKIGVLASLSGPAAFIGNSYIEGLTKAQEEINSLGGINSKKVELILEDNQNLAQTGITAYKALQVRDPDLIISTMSTPTVAIAPIAKDSGIPLFVSLVFADVLPIDPNAVAFFPTAMDDAKATIRGMQKNRIKSVGVIFLNSEYGKASADALINEANKTGIKIVGIEAFDGVANDFSTPLQKILTKKPDALYVAAINAIPITKETKLFGPKPMIFTNLIPVFGGLVYSDKDTFKGVHLTASAVSIPQTKEYADFENKFPQNNSAGYTSIGYDNLYSIKAVLEKNSDVNSFVNTFQILGSFLGINGQYLIDSRNISMQLYPVVFDGGKIMPDA